MLADGATAVWGLRSTTALQTKDTVPNLAPGSKAATVVDGAIATTTGPDGTGALRFAGGGRIVTALTTGLASTDSFTLEVAVRADDCVGTWGRVIGDTSYPTTGREGFEILHFPSQFAANPCRFGAELWNHNSYVGGCHPTSAPVVGRWSQLAVTYRPGVLSCYLDGHLFDTSHLPAGSVFTQPGPLGIGGSASGYQGTLDGASISDVAYYPTAIPAAQVANHNRLLRLPPVAPVAGPAPTPS